MTEHHLLKDVGISILGAGGLAMVFFYLRLPLILGYLLAGMLLGPHFGLGLVKDLQNISTLSEIGLIFLMFILGMEIDLRKIKQIGKPVLLNGFGQFFGCFLLALGCFSFLDFDFLKGPYSLFYVAMAASLSSTLIVVKILSERMELDALTSRITIGILVLQDLWAITFLAMQPNLSDFKPLLVFLSLGKAILLIGAAWFSAKYLLPRIFKKAAKQPELMLIIAVSWCFGTAGLADLLNLSKEMGALVAGVTIASFPYHLDISAKIFGLRDFFITLFFVALGMQIPLPSSQVIIFTLLLVLFAVFSRILTIFPVLYGMKYGNRAGLIPGINLGQLSEFSLVLLTLGMKFGHIGPQILSSFILALVVTSVISSFLIPRSQYLFRRFNPYLEKLGFKDRLDSQIPEENGERREPTIVLLGFYREASSLLMQLQKRHTREVLKQILIIDFNPETHEKLNRLGVSCKYGDISHLDTLYHLHLDKAKIIISTVPDHLLKGTNNLKLLRILKKVSPEANLIMTAETFSSAREMYKEGAGYVFLPRLVSAHFLADVIERIQTGNMNAITKNAGQHLHDWEEALP